MTRALGNSLSRTKSTFLLKVGIHEPIKYG